MNSLSWFLWIYITIQVFAGLARIMFLGNNKYPRISTWERGEDLLALIFGAAFAIWAWTLLP